jgi:hypothetical protein
MFACTKCNASFYFILNRTKGMENISKKMKNEYFHQRKISRLFKLQEVSPPRT